MVDLDRECARGAVRPVSVGLMGTSAGVFGFAAHGYVDVPVRCLLVSFGWVSGDVYLVSGVVVLAGRGIPACPCCMLWYR